MAYGSMMPSLSPCSPEDTLGLIRDYAPDADSVIDVGCGRGETLSLLSREMPGCVLFGLEPDAENAECARIACPSARILGVSAEEYAGSGEAESFSVVLAECVFSLMDEPERGAAALKALLGPGGALILSDLFTPGAEGGRISDGTVKNIYPRPVLEGFFARAGLEPLAFFDRRSDMLALAGQMIMDGAFCGCIDAGAFAALRRLRAGYGVWVFKEAEK